MHKNQVKPPQVPDHNRLKSLYENHFPHLENILHALAQRIRKLLVDHGYTPTIKFRVKRFDAYYAKLRNLSASHRKKSFPPITDLLGLRIICPFMEDIENLAQLIASEFDVVETERKATQHSFREFGYDSLHQQVRLPTESLDVPLPGAQPSCEIQLRTILQDAWAEVEHELVYKSDISLPNESIRRKLAALNATLTLSDLIFQEIRDYQKELRLRGHLRRASLAENGEENPLIAISHPAGKQVEAKRLGPVPSSMASGLEKTMLLALEAHSNHELDRAIELYDQLLGMRLKKKIRALVYNHRGMAHFAKGNFRQALKDFSRSISYDPNNERGFANRGLCHRVLQRYDRSLEDFNSALLINATRLESCFGRAQTYYDMQLYSRALADCEKTLGIDPGYRPAQELAKRLRREML